MTAIGQEEKDAVMRVLDSGLLSGYIAGSHFGGKEVNALEDEWAKYFGFKHAIAMNSATSCLIAACGALGLEAGDDVVVPALTMSATAVAPMVYGANVHFSEIERDYFCLDPDQIDWNETCAIITVDIFGQSSHPRLHEMAYNKGIKVIQDASQRPIPGGFGDIVVHSLNYHKHIHCGEGGMACTNNDFLAEKMRLIRNHGECGKSLIIGYPYKGLFGFNFRLTEIQAAIARVQLTKLEAEVKRRQELARTIPDLAPVRPGFDHAWYLFPHERELLGSFRYQKPLYNLPLFPGRPGNFPVTEQVWQSIWMTRP
jgi:dTDP-4-amino-4,6-dideoxygalactose transaminase